MITIGLESARNILVDTFKELYIDNELKLTEDTIIEVLAGEIEVGQRITKEYYETYNDEVILVKSQTVINKELEILRFADDEIDKDLDNVTIEDDGKGYDLIFKRITKTSPIEGVSVVVFKVHGE